MILIMLLNALRMHLKPFISFSEHNCCKILSNFQTKIKLAKIINSNMCTNYGCT